MCPLTPAPTEGGIGATLGPRNNSVRVLGCPLTLGSTQGGIGAAHGPQKEISGSTGAFPNPRTNSRRYRSRPRVRETTQRE